jgi:hypothetical protein
MFNKSKKHLSESNISYFDHMTFAIYAGFRLLLAGISSIIHSIIPSLFSGTAAKTVIDLYFERLQDHPNKNYKEYIEKKQREK